MAKLINKLSKADALARVQAEPFKRVTLSFYKYVRLADPKSMRDRLWKDWTAFQVLGRIYVATEGINAQVSVPEHTLDAFRKHVDSFSEFNGVPFKIGVEENGIAFWKLTIKVKRQIVADDLPIDSYDVENVGTHLTAKEWNEAMDSGAIVVDMRNKYESAIGHFEGAITPEALTFREELPMVLDELKGKEEEKVLLYCTGGVRCEKTSAFLKHHGFKDVNQLHGGIIDYAHQIKREGLESKFIGKNFVFDARRDETITEDILTNCTTCNEPSNIYVDCKNTMCHVLFIQCDSCQEKMNTCCSEECKQISLLPLEEQRRLRKGVKAKFKVLQ